MPPRRRRPRPRPAPLAPAPPGGAGNPYRGPAMASDPSADRYGLGSVLAGRRAPRRGDVPGLPSVAIVAKVWPSGTAHVGRGIRPAPGVRSVVIAPIARRGPAGPNLNP